MEAAIIPNMHEIQTEIKANNGAYIVLIAQRSESLHFSVTFQNNLEKFMEDILFDSFKKEKAFFFADNIGDIIDSLALLIEEKNFTIIKKDEDNITLTFEFVLFCKNLKFSINLKRVNTSSKNNDRPICDVAVNAMAKEIAELKLINERINKKNQELFDNYSEMKNKLNRLENENLTLKIQCLELQNNVNAFIANFKENLKIQGVLMDQEIITIRNLESGKRLQDQQNGYSGFVNFNKGTWEQMILEKYK